MPWLPIYFAPHGRPKGLSAEAQIKARAVQAMYALKTHTIPEIGQLFHLSRATVYRYLAWQELKEQLIQKMGVLGCSS